MRPPWEAKARMGEKTMMTAAAPARVGRSRWGRSFAVEE
jgi:hypothetical protein